MAMDNLKLGQIIPDDVEQQRDAIHIAVAPVVANGQLDPGQHIGFLPNGKVGVCEKPIGIVDPYLEHPVYKNQKFWMYLYPGSITSLRHDWTHPAFAGEEKEDAERWMSRFCGQVAIPYETVMDAAKDWLTSGGEDWYVQVDREDARDFMSDAVNRAEFWRNYEVITGTKIADKVKQEGYVFSCSC